MISLENLLASTGMRSDDQKKFISKMNAASRDYQTETKLRKALVEAGVPAELHDKVVDAVDGQQHVPSAHTLHASGTDGRLAKIAAAAETPAGAAKLKNALGELNRIGISLETAIDKTALNNALKGYDPQRRMVVKAALASAAIID